jgi:preprotein translocase subunit SecA
MVLDKLLRLGEGRKAKQLQRIVDKVLSLESEVEQLTDDELKAKTPEFRQRLEDGETLDELQPEVFAVVREAAWRVLHQKPYPVQVFGGCALHDGMIAEMKTGEGKTLTSTMPVYLNALAGEGVHIVTVNEYLARRDAEWMGSVHRFLGLEVGSIYSQQPRESKKQAYNADITYGTTNEFGFDYLRDNMAWEKRLQVQRGHRYALIDEVDSILVDEARTPLIISGPAEQSAQWYEIFARRVVPNLKKGEDLGQGETSGDYVVDESKRTVAITEDGVHKVEQLLGMDNLYESVNTPLIQHLNNALKARELFKRDREYIVSDGEVKIVDEHTGRVLEGRRYSEGLHQSIEAKEGVTVKDENQTLATVTLQNYYRTYDKLAGMTGTAKTEEVEFKEIYELDVVLVPTNEPVIRDDESDLIYKSELSKFQAVVDDIAERHAKGQPVLVGTTSVEKSELVSTLLKRKGVSHNVLNAKNHAREAHIVAQAGRSGAVTVSTNMAGRGTDIVLGGNHEEMARDEVNKLPEDATDEQKREVYTEALSRFERETREDRETVVQAGGLYVIGTERHESRRIDDQLRGRSGRQGDPGGSRFFLSLEDDLMRLFNASAVERIMTRLNIPEEVPIEHKWVTRAVANAQRQVESRNFDIRKNVLKYDDVLNEQRKVVYGQRQRLIENDQDEVDELAQKYVDDVVTGAVNAFCPPGVYPEEWDVDGVRNHLEQIYDCTYDFSSIDIETIDREELIEALLEDTGDAYETRETEVGGHDVMREVERRVILSVVDRKWREHLYEMDALRDGIGLRAVGQRDPLVEYQREAYDSFVGMMESVKDESVTYFFRLPVKQQGDEESGQGGDGGIRVDAGSAARTASGAQGQAMPRRAAAAQGDAAPQAPAASTDAASPAASDGNGQPTPGIQWETRKQPQNLTYSSSKNTSSASYTVGASASGGGANVEHRQDGTTVRQVSGGGTYKKDATDEFAEAGRNDPCPCGSGQKFKRCHGA